MTVVEQKWPKAQEWPELYIKWGKPHTCLPESLGDKSRVRGQTEQPVLLTVATNYSWFITESWAQFVEPAYAFNINICWPISLSVGLFWCQMRDFRSGNSSFAKVSCSSTRGTKEKWQRERWGTELEGWMLTVLCAGGQVELSMGCCSAFRSTMKCIPSNSLKTLHMKGSDSGRLPVLCKNRVAALVFNCLTSFW